MAATTKKTSFSLPHHTVGKLDTVARVAGVTRSALLTELVSDRLDSLYDLVKDMGSSASDSPASRQQASADHLARKRLNALLATLGLEDDTRIQ